MLMNRIGPASYYQLTNEVRKCIRIIRRSNYQTNKNQNVRASLARYEERKRKMQKNQNLERKSVDQPVLSADGARGQGSIKIHEKKFSFVWFSYFLLFWTLLDEPLCSLSSSTSESTSNSRTKNSTISAKTSAWSAFSTEKVSKAYWLIFKIRI